MVLSTDKVADTLVMARYASVCVSEKGILNDVVETESGHDVVLTDDGNIFRFIARKEG